jgi:hypothetical protein
MSKKRVTRSFDGSVSKYARKNKTGEIVRYRWQLWVPETPGDPNSPLQRLGKGGFETREEAQDALSDARRDHDSIRTKKAPLFGVYADQWVEALRLAASTVAGYKRALKHVSPTFGKRSLDTITPSDITRLYRQLEKSGRIDSKHKGEGLSANTVGKVHVTLSNSSRLRSSTGGSSRTRRRLRQSNRHRGNSYGLRSARSECGRLNSCGRSSSGIGMFTGTTSIRCGRRSPALVCDGRKFSRCSGRTSPEVGSR